VKAARREQAHRAMYYLPDTYPPLVWDGSVRSPLYISLTLPVAECAGQKVQRTTST